MRGESPGYGRRSWGRGEGLGENAARERRRRWECVRKGGLPAPLYLCGQGIFLRGKDAVTNWDQGQVGLDELLACVRAAFGGRRVIGMDCVRRGAWGGGSGEKKRQSQWSALPCAILMKKIILICNSKCSFQHPPVSVRRNDTNFRSAPSMELMLSEGQSSRMSCFVNRPTFSMVALRTVSSAGSFVSTRAKRSPKILVGGKNGSKQILDKRHYIFGAFMPSDLCLPQDIIIEVLVFCNLSLQRDIPAHIKSAAVEQQCGSADGSFCRFRH